MPAFKPQPEQELYGVLGDQDDIYKELMRKRDSQYLSRYPSFHQSAVPSPAVGAFPSSSLSVPATPPSGFQVKRLRTRRSQDVRRSEDNDDEAQDSGASAEPTAKSWYDQDAEVWKPKNPASKLTRSSAPPSRPQPAAPVETFPSSTTFPAGILITEPAQKFTRVKGPHKSAMKTPAPTAPQQPAPLPATAYLSPEVANQRRRMFRQTPAAVQSPPSTVAASSLGGAPYHLSPATTHGRLSSATTSHRGSSTGTSSVALTSSSFYSNSQPYSAISSKKIVEDGEPEENPAPRQTLFVVNADPESSESDRSPVKSYNPQFPVVPPKPVPSRRRTKEVTRVVPPVPPLPVQFQAPPPPVYPPGGRSRSDPVVPGESKLRSERDRSRLGRHSSDNRPGANHATSKPIPIPPISKHSSGAGSLTHSDSGPSSSSRSQSPLTPPQQGAAPIAADIPAEWIYPLPLTLEELFKGGKYTYRITTRLLSGAPKIQEVEVDVKPGWKSGTRIIFPAAGNERKPGVFQDMIFVVEQVHHERFARLDGGRLVLNQDIDLVDALKEGDRQEPRKVVGLDGNVIQFYPPSGVIRTGKETVVKGQGMYIRSKSQVKGRGDLIIRWNVIMPKQSLTPDQIHRMRDIFH